MEQKKLKKLELKKEQIVNLNDKDMMGIHGGDGTTTVTVSSNPCAIALSIIIESIIGYTIETTTQDDYYGTAFQSEVMIPIQNEQTVDEMVCELPEIEIPSRGTL